MSDGLTVPFALAAGLSGAVDSTGIVVTAGLAEIAAGSIAMGLGVAGAYIVGGFIPLGPYLVWSSVKTGLLYSVAVTLLALAVFGYVKGHFTGTGPVRSAIQTVVIGGLAAAAAFGIARAIS